MIHITSHVHDFKSHILVLSQVMERYESNLITSITVNVRCKMKILISLILEIMMYTIRYSFNCNQTIADNMKTFYTPTAQRLQRRKCQMKFMLLIHTLFFFLKTKYHLF